jgi:predicted oxidoreductase
MTVIRISEVLLPAAIELAEKYNTGLNEILLAWLHTHPSNILSVIGTTKIERLLQAKVATSIRLEREDWFKAIGSFYR